MLETIEIYAAQGVDGFLLDPYTDSFTRINEILVEHKIPWIPCMTLPTDSNGQLLGPAVGFDNKAFGVQMANWTIDYAKKAWPNAKVSQIGMLSMDFSLSPQIHERTIGAQSTWNQHYPQANFFIADGKDTSDLSADAGYALTASVFDAHPNIKYWLICTFSDDYAQGASAAAVQYGKQNSCVVIDCGGSALINQWDSGKTTCWKASVYVPQMMFAEPMICGLYAMIDGQATAETLWPSWTDKKAGDKYAFLKMPSFVLTKDNYKEYLEWVDTYTGFDLSHYPYHGTQFSARATPPTY